MIVGCKINGIDTLEKYGMALLAGVEIEPAKPKTKYIELLGSDKRIDLSTVLAGRLLYDYRKVKFKLASVANNWDDTTESIVDPSGYPAGADNETMEKIRSVMISKYHGRTVTVQFPEQDYYFTGVMDVGNYDPEERTLEFELDAEPYRTSAITSSQTGSVQEGGSVAVKINGPVEPVMGSNVLLYIHYNGKSYSFNNTPSGQIQYYSPKDNDGNPLVAYPDADGEMKIENISRRDASTGPIFLGLKFNDRRL